MKKQLKYGFMMLALGVGLQSITSAQETQVGVKAGALYNMPVYGNKAVGNTDAKFGVQAGFFARTAQKLYVQGELTFSTFKSTYMLEQKKHEPTFYQVNLPVHVGYRVFESENLSVRTAIGPQLNYNVKKQQATSTADFTNFTYDGSANVGIDIKQIALDLRYNHSLNKTSKELDSRNRMIGLSVGYRF